MGRFDPSDRHSDDLIAAIEAATHSINHTLREGFKLIALQMAKSQGAASQGVDNSAAIEAEANRLKGLTAQLAKPPST